jgi:hypothetical protein
VRNGFKPIEFEKGKTSCLDKLTAVIDVLIAAVRAGELGDKIAPVKKPRKAA